MFGIEKLHPFDAAKFRRVADGLAARGLIGRPGRFGAGRRLVEPLEAPEAALLDVHAAGYLGALRSSSRKVAEVGGPRARTLGCYLGGGEFDAARPRPRPGRASGGARRHGWVHDLKPADASVATVLGANLRRREAASGREGCHATPNR